MCDGDWREVDFVDVVVLELGVVLDTTLSSYDLHLDGIVGDGSDDALTLHDKSVVDVEQALLEGGCRLLDVEPVDVGEELP